MDRCSISSYVYIVVDCHGEERVEPKGEVINLCPSPHLWSQASGSNRKNEVMVTSNKNELPSQGV